MMNSDTYIILKPHRGTKLFISSDNDQIITFHIMNDYQSQMNEIFLIIGEVFSNLASIESQNQILNKKIIRIPIKTPYMIINLSSVDLHINFLENPLFHQILYDPYLYESEHLQTINPELIRLEYSIPTGYIDVLSKWYSIKFTYPQMNYIFIRPHLGISIQTHNSRAEQWEILQGHPITLINNRVNYNTQPKDRFSIPKNTFHCIINPTNDWVLVSEQWTGIFDEKDISRIFNPNAYFD